MCALKRPAKEANLIPMSRLRLFLSCALASVSLSACASLPSQSADALKGPEAATPPAPNLDAPASTYGLFLAAQAAVRSGQDEQASLFYLRAAHQSPDADFLRSDAFLAALAAGDVPRAADLAPLDGGASPSDVQLGRLTVAAEDLAEGRASDAEGVLRAPFSGLNRPAGDLMGPWAAAAAGDWKTALALPEAKEDRLLLTLAQLNQALLLEEGHRYTQADAAYRAQLTGGDAAAAEVISAYVDFLLRRNRRPDAVAVVDKALADDPSNRALSLLHARLEAKTPPPPLPSLTAGAGRALFWPAAVFLAEKQPEMALDYLQLILRLDTDRDEAWLLAGDTKVMLGDVDGGRAAYLHVRAGSPDYLDARERLIQTYDSTNDAATVLVLAQETVKADPGDDEALELLADALSQAEQYPEAAQVLDTLLQHLGAKAGWQTYFMRGVALDHSGHWAEAEADFRKALTLKPDESEVLNYLGYSWIDRGEKLEEAKAMVQRAVDAKPDSGAMIDSLGWAYYRLGQFGQAVSELERATELEPADPDINNHLGDAYWRAGRRTEARFQWQRVLTLEPTPKMKAEVEDKLKNGLADDGKPAGPAPTVAAR